MKYLHFGIIVTAGIVKENYSNLKRIQVKIDNHAFLIYMFKCLNFITSSKWHSQLTLIFLCNKREVALLWRNCPQVLSLLAPV